MKGRHQLVKKWLAERSRTTHPSAQGETPVVWGFNNWNTANFAFSAAYSLRSRNTAFYQAQMAIRNSISYIETQSPEQCLGRPIPIHTVETRCLDLWLSIKVPVSPLPSYNGRMLTHLSRTEFLKSRMPYLASQRSGTVRACYVRT